MPKVSIGINAPPDTALFALSDAPTPSLKPVPNNSGCFDARFASLYPKNAAILPPAPGTIPTMIPMIEERRYVRGVILTEIFLSLLP